MQIRVTLTNNINTEVMDKSTVYPTIDIVAEEPNNNKAKVCVEIREMAGSLHIKGGDEGVRRVVK